LRYGRHGGSRLRAIRDGSIAILRDEIREAILEAYVAIGAANLVVDAASRHPMNSTPWAAGVNDAQRRIAEAQPKIERAREELLKFLAAEPPAA